MRIENNVPEFLKTDLVTKKNIRSAFKLVNFLILGICLFNSPSYGEDTNTCDGPWAGKTPSSQELQDILSTHKVWVEKYREARAEKKTIIETDGMRRANLCGAKLLAMDLKGIYLPGADLRSVAFLNSQLDNADLAAADMMGIEMYFGSFFGADLSGARLDDAYLLGVDLREVRFYNADMKRTKLLGADLSGAVLMDVDMTDAELNGANLRATVFEAKPGKLPNIINMSYKTDLSKMTYLVSSSSLAELRDAYKKAGMRKQERELTYAIRSTDSQRATFIERLFNVLLFDLTSQYGLSPWRPILLIGVLVPIAALLYTIALARKGYGGIWAVWSADRIYKDEGSDSAIRVTHEFPFPGTALARHSWAWLLRWPRAYAVALYFSVLTAFNIGWRDFNVGSWINRVQSREYTLRATGWVRTISGIQSVISVYLLALWALTYFGRPFE